MFEILGCVTVRRGRESLGWVVHQREQGLSNVVYLLEKGTNQELGPNLPQLFIQ